MMTLGPAPATPPITVQLPPDAEPTNSLVVRWNDFGRERQRDLLISLDDADAGGVQRVTGASTKTRNEHFHFFRGRVDLSQPDVRKAVELIAHRVAQADEPLERYRGNWVAGRLGEDSAEDIKDRAWKFERDHRGYEVFGGRLNLRGNAPGFAKDVIDAARFIYEAHPATTPSRLYSA